MYQMRQTCKNMLPRKRTQVAKVCGESYIKNRLRVEKKRTTTKRKNAKAAGTSEYIIFCEKGKKN